ncbi:hypothetical protein A2V82_03505 [candidate division KSB1 bacterium RBG_16_48_16]|nr:MAG: hypothetical protein A2V82_03505 [candidate division KSB1 bacterium RBG_16_48_16]
MKRIFFLFNLAVLLIFCISVPNLKAENVKLAQTGFQFLSITSDARAAAMAGAMTSAEMRSSSLFFNPACMANMTPFVDISISHNKWIADITHNTFSLALNPQAGRYGVLGVSIQSTDYGTVLGTRVDMNAQKGFVDTGELSPSAFAFGVGYAKALSDRFSVGAQVKWVKQDLEDSVIPVTDSTTTTKSYELSPFAFDFGTLFKTGFKSLAFGMSIRNFSKEISFEQEGFQLPLVYTMGVSMDLMDFFEMTGSDQSLYLTIDATHYRSHPEQILVGLDYKIMNLLSLRGGLATNNDEDNFTFGFGVSQFGLMVDYAYTPFGVFDQVQRVTARFSL